jgi:Rhs element Vgr protein
MTSQPLTDKTDLVTSTILVNGAALSSSYKVFSINIYKELNRVSNAIIELLDGDPATDKFPVIDTGALAPGAEITISLGYHFDEANVFKGVVTKNSLKSDGNSSPVFTVEAKDVAVKLTGSRNNKIFEAQTDSDIIESIISSYGISHDIDSTTYINKELVQYYCTDWDFINVRAEYNGLYVLADMGMISARKPDTSKDPVLELDFGASIIRMELEADSEDQVQGFQAFGWNYSTQEFLSANSVDPGLNFPGNFSPAEFSGVLGLSNVLVQSTSPLEQEDIQNWANAAILKSQLSMIRGTLTFQGNASVLPGTVVSLVGCGDRFNGNVFISGVTHAFEEGNWETTIQVGGDPKWYAAVRPSIEASQASGILPGISGLQNAIVKQIDQDPNNELRVLVTVPVFNNETIWARLTTQYATNGAGIYFYPEIGDEVIVGFSNNDPRYPVILGSVHSSTRTPAYTPDTPNTFKGIVSNGKIKIEMDDVKKIVTITTPGNNKIVLNDEDGTINISDQNGNKIGMSSSGISIDSASDITLSAKGSISASSGADTSLSATGDFSISGLSVSGSAETQMSMKGSATAEFSASGQVAVKGAIVMIN